MNRIGGATSVEICWVPMPTKTIALAHCLVEVTGLNSDIVLDFPNTSTWARRRGVSLKSRPVEAFGPS
jgi:hypothetical protein